VSEPIAMRTSPAATAARAGGRAARNVLTIPGITRRRKRQIEARTAEREFMGGKLAEQHRALRLEFALDTEWRRGT